MANYRDAALAAHAAAVAAEQGKAAAERQALIDAARLAVKPLLTDPAGKVLLDPSKLTVEHVDVPNRLVILRTADGSAVTFGAQDRDGWTVRLVTGTVEDGWTSGPVVTDLDDVGAQLAAG